MLQTCSVMFETELHCEGCGDKLNEPRIVLPSMDYKYIHVHVQVHCMIFIHSKNNIVTLTKTFVTKV